MDYLDLITSFHKKYAKRWYVIKDKRFFRFLLSSLVIAAGIVYYLANHSFDIYDLQRSIGDRYKEYLVGIYDQEDFSRIELYDIDAEQEKVERVRRRSAGGDKSEGAEKGEGVSAHKDLLIDADDFETLSYDIEGVPPATRFFKHSNRSKSNVVSSDELLLLNDYKIYRNAAIYIDMPEYLMEEKTHYVYRDQDDILKVIYSKSGIIESCYQKALRNAKVKPGFVKVEFHIAASGYVLPATIRILDSTIRSKEVEQCIKKNIRRWRNFEKLENSEGIAHVVHKFVFN